MSKFVQTNFTLVLKQKSTTFINATSLHVNLELTLVCKYLNKIYLVLFAGSSINLAEYHGANLQSNHDSKTHTKWTMRVFIHAFIIIYAILGTYK